MTGELTQLEASTLAESYDLECKAAQGRDGRGELPEDFWKSYSAMANTDGGIILLGVQEKPRGHFQSLGIKNESPGLAPERGDLPPELGALPQELDALPPELSTQLRNPVAYLTWSEVPEQVQRTLIELAAPVSGARRTDPDLLCATVLQLCSGRFLGRHVLAYVLQRNADDLLKRTLNPLVKTGRLTPAHPSSRDPRQAYTTAVCGNDQREDQS